MEENQPEHFKKILYSLPVSIILAIICFMMLFSVIGMIGKYRDVLHKKKVAETDLANLQKRQETLDNQVKQLDTPFGKESVIREKFGVAKDGEGVIMIVEDQPKQTVENQSLLSSLRSLFKKR